MQPFENFDKMCLCGAVLIACAVSCLPARASARSGINRRVAAPLAAPHLHPEISRGAVHGSSDRASQVVLVSEGASSRFAQDLETRPSLGGSPDIVEFGIKVKDIVAIATREGTFTADVVLTFRWSDPRTAHLIPEGLPKITLSPKKAAAKIWMPDMQVTNHEIDGLQPISECVSVAKGGRVTRTLRLIGLFLNRFDMTSFPFDMPRLEVRVASATLMKDELQLQPIKDESFKGASADIFKGTDLVLTDVRERVFEEDDGMLEKSRGELVLATRRDFRVYLRQKLVPSLFLVIVGFGVFFFPLDAPFAMPRVSTSLIAFLALVTLGTNSHRGGASWIDLFEEACQILLFCTVFLNMFVLITKHEFKMGDLALRMDHELKILPAILAGLNFVLLFLYTRPKEFPTASTTTRTVTAVGGLGYLSWSVFRLNSALVERGKGGVARLAWNVQAPTPNPSNQVAP